MSPLAVAFPRPRQVSFVDEPSRPVGADEVRVRTLYSGISTGTELSAYRGTNPYLHKRWDAEQRLFVPEPDPAAATLRFPIVGYGYEEVGEVVEASADAGIPVGSVLYGTWGHRAEQVLDAAHARGRILPPGADPRLGIFSHIGPIALNGVLDAAPRLTETVVVFGLGVVGQLVSQLLRLAGARVIGVEILAERRGIARRLGLETLLDPSDGSAAEQVKALTDGRGADVCVEASGAIVALHEAIRCCAPNSRVVALGFYQGDATGLALGEEFHHNRVTLLSSQIGGVSAELQGRWDRRRLVGAFMGLAVSGQVRCLELISHAVPAREAAAIFRLMDERPREVLQAVLDFRADG